MRSSARSILTAFVLSTAAVACVDLSGPERSGERLLLFFDDRIEEIDLGSGERWERLDFADLGADRRNYRITTVGSDVFLGLSADGKESEIVRLDLCTMTVESRLPMGSPTQKRTIDGVEFSGNAFGVSGDGEIAYLSGIGPDGVHGATALDLATERVLAFSGPFRQGLPSSWLPPTAEHPDGLLYGTAARDETGERRLYLLHPETLELADSLSAADAELPLILGAMTATPDGGGLYLSSWVSVVRYDPGRGEVGSRRRFSGVVGWVRYWISGDGRVMMVLDHGTPDFPGSGVVRIADAALDPIGEVDVNAALGDATDFKTALLTEDGSTAYIVSGRSPPAESGYLPARIVVVDLESRSLEKAVDLSTVPYPGVEIPDLMIPPDCG